ncbi:hypothetical protein ACHAWF_007486 [Thalassiosira exigua]
MSEPLGTLAPGRGRALLGCGQKDGVEAHVKMPWNAFAADTFQHVLARDGILCPFLYQHMLTNFHVHNPTDTLALDIYTPSERREYLVRRGEYCHPRGGGSSGSVGGLASSAGGNGGADEDSSLQWYDVLSRYDSLVAASEGPTASAELGRAAVELFKFCVLSNGDGHAFWGWGEQLLLPLRDVVGPEGNYAAVSVDGSLGGLAEAGKVSDSGGEAPAAAGDGEAYVHESFLSVSPRNPATTALSAAIRLLLETPDDVLARDPRMLAREMGRLVAAAAEEDNADSASEETGKDDAGRENEEGGKGKGPLGGGSWTLLRSGCIPLAEDLSAEPPSLAVVTDALAGSSGGSVVAQSRRATAARCPRSGGGYCCLAFPQGAKGGDADDGEVVETTVPVMALRHPAGGWTSGGRGAASRAAPERAPYAMAHGSEGSGKSSKPGLGGLPEADLPYASTVRLTEEKAPYQPPPEGPAPRFPTPSADGPNFFDILFENDCLPYRKECHACLKDVANDREDAVPPSSGLMLDAGAAGARACSKCGARCPCFCDVLCRVRPPPKPVARVYAVRPPSRRKEPHRHVPKIIHQTWYEPVTREGYPNMSRLIESWKRSGWEYYFYDDESAGEFLGTHFPPEVKEAYDSITPGAFKADLFRYCVLLIRGGVYADMDVLLETNLDDAIADDVGFMAPIDEPGSEVGHRSCLWNGLIASAPGHPFLARTIEIVVNNIRNRFTAVDYDDMLCPNPILSVSHTVDTLFTAGPCILGASINNLLKRHMQEPFEVGDVDVWREGSGENATGEARPDDPRRLVPGRTVVLSQDKNDMGAHRFTWTDRHLIVAATDMPDYDDRPPTKEHYSKTHEKAGVYGLRKLYTDARRANEEIRFVVERA